MLSTDDDFLKLKHFKSSLHLLPLNIFVVQCVPFIRWKKGIRENILKHYLVISRSFKLWKSLVLSNVILVKLYIILDNKAEQYYITCLMLHLWMFVWCIWEHEWSSVFVCLLQYSYFQCVLSLICIVPKLAYKLTYFPLLSLNIFMSTLVNFIVYMHLY